MTQLPGADDFQVWVLTAKCNVDISMMHAAGAEVGPSQRVDSEYEMDSSNDELGVIHWKWSLMLYFSSPDKTYSKVTNKF